MKKKHKKLWGSGTLKIYDAEIDVYVLEDGTTLIGKTKILKALGRPKKSNPNKERPTFISANNLTPFVREELDNLLKGVDFYDGGMKRNAYHSDILPLVCNVYLEARQAGVLTTSQIPVAEKCEILLRSFARVGLTALIHEQIGFEKYKHPEALRMLIESYLSDEIRKWSKEFPDELFFQMDRIYKNQKTTSRNRPLYYAKFIRKYIYTPIERGEVLKRLDQKIPKNEKGFKTKRLHSAASVDVGLPAIKSQIWQVIALLKLSPNKRKFESNFERMMGQSFQGDLFED